jgi:hypothetical protein
MVSVVLAVGNELTVSVRVALTCATFAVVVAVSAVWSFVVVRFGVVRVVVKDAVA